MTGHRRSIQRTGIAGLAGAVWVAVGVAQANWEAPEKERQTPSPIERTAQSVEIGHRLYRENCETCHGVEGRGDGPGARVLEARLPDFTNAAWAGTKTDGEWFYKISVGRDPMVGYEDFLEEVEIWHTVNFLRSLNSGEKGNPGATTGSIVAQAVDSPAAPTEVTTETALPEADVRVDTGVSTPSPDLPASSTADEAANAHAVEGSDEAAPAMTATPGDHDPHDGDYGAQAARAGSHGPAPADFDPKGISNYESTHAKAPLVWALVIPVLIGAIFVAFQKMVPPPPGSEAPSGGGHGHDHGHGHH